MNLEAIGIAALCVSQAGMWIGNWRLRRQALTRNDAAHKLLGSIESRALRGAHAAEDARDMLRDRTDRERGLLDANRAFCEMRDEIRVALARMPQRRNRRRPNPAAPIDLVPTTISPLEREKRVTPSSDPVGKVSS
jgi:hypothetical protein